MLKSWVDLLSWLWPRRTRPIRNTAALLGSVEWSSRSWTFLTSWGGGSCVLAPGLDIRDAKWQPVVDPHTGVQRTIVAADDIYGDLHTVGIWYIEHDSRPFVFAADEVTNGVFLVFVPSLQAQLADSNQLQPHKMRLPRVTLHFSFGHLMRASRRALLLLLVIAPCGTTTMAQTPAPDANPAIEAQSREKDFPSPDERFAFVTFSKDDEHLLDLVEARSGKTLQRIAEEDSIWARWDVSWSPDSSKFAVMTRLSHASQSIDIYAKTGADFVKIELPAPLVVDVPERLKHGKSFPHFANLNWAEATAWRRDGSLVVTVTTAVDGAAGSILAERRVTVSFDAANTPKLATSNVRYKIERP